MFIEFEGVVVSLWAVSLDLLTQLISIWLFFDAVINFVAWAIVLDASWLGLFDIVDVAFGSPLIFY